MILSGTFISTTFYCTTWISRSFCLATSHLFLHLMTFDSSTLKRMPSHFEEIFACKMSDFDGQRTFYDSLRCISSPFSLEKPLIAHESFSRQVVSREQRCQMFFLLTRLLKSFFSRKRVSKKSTIWIIWLALFFSFVFVCFLKSFHPSSRLHSCQHSTHFEQFIRSSFLT